MASIDITTQSGAVGNGDLQLQNGAPMDGTLRFVTDAVNTASPLKLSTSLVQTTSTLKITTNDNPYIDAEDGTGNNRFTIGRDSASQQVNVDFASNPTGSTTNVGAIRTYVDGVNLSEVMTFREDGKVGIGTTTPTLPLDILGGVSNGGLKVRAGNTTSQNILDIANNGGTQGFYYRAGDNVLQYYGYDFSIESQSSGGNILLNSGAASGEVRINGASGGRLSVKGKGSTSATTALLVQNSSGFNAIQVTDDLKVNINSLVFGGNNGYIGINNSPSIDSALRSVRTNGGSSPLSISTGEVGVGDTTTYPSAIFVVSSTTRGFLPPRMTNAQRAAIATPAVGLMVYCTDAVEGLYVYKSTGWTFVI